MPAIKSRLTILESLFSQRLRMEFCRVLPSSYKQLLNLKGAFKYTHHVSQIQI
jgi:hypothetical protein